MVRHLQRVPLGTSYPLVVEAVREALASEELRGRCSLTIDATGLGAPVLDMLRAARLGCERWAGEAVGRELECAEARFDGGFAGAAGAGRVEDREGDSGSGGFGEGVVERSADSQGGGESAGGGGWLWAARRSGDGGGSGGGRLPGIS